jgi:hypothetical protein
MLYWFLADMVLAFHIALFVSLGIGVVLAALGYMRRHRNLNLLFWPVFAVSMGWALIPVECGLTELEVWLRQQVEPGWTRPLDLPQTVAQWLTGRVMPRQLFVAMGLFMVGLAILGFWRSFFKKGRAPQAPVP